jgi:hypothetical protein
VLLLSHARPPDLVVLDHQQHRGSRRRQPARYRMQAVGHMVLGVRGRHNLAVEHHMAVDGERCSLDLEVHRRSLAAMGRMTGSLERIAAGRGNFGVVGRHHREVGPVARNGFYRP